MTGSVPLLGNARSMTAGYSDSEDRLWLRFGAPEGAVQTWLTRRLLGQVLDQMWIFMQDSSPPIPGSSADVPATDAARALALRAERQVALEPRPPTTEDQGRQNAAPAASHKPAQAGVLARIMVERAARGIKLTFVGSAGQVVMSCNRHEVHRMMNMLARRGESCGWRLPTAWLED